jgi:hypothetical protein
MPKHEIIKIFGERKTGRKVVSPLNASDTGALDVDSNGGLLT